MTRGTRQTRTGSSDRAVKVRMYDTGFGDAFLLTFPAEDRPRKVLIDCGYHTAGPPPVPMKTIVETIVGDVTEKDGPRIDVVVCTHRHQDHVRGFERADAWAGVRVGEVWMPWTEHPTDPEACEVRETQAKRARDLHAALAGMTGLDVSERERIQALIDNSLTNALAMGVLHHGFSGSPELRFLPEMDNGSLARTAPAPLLPGVKVHVLGPARDQGTIRDMEPPRDEAFLRAARASGQALPLGADLRRWAISPTGEDFRIWFNGMAATVQHGVSPGPVRTGDPDFLNRWFASLGFRWNDVRAVDTVGEKDPLAAAVALDAAVNGTSLMLVFEVGRACLLFCGDAQWGTWRRALADPAWHALLARTTFLKVGHHGSHNATPVRFVADVLPKGAQVMVPTRVTEKFPEIPRPPLLDALQTKLAGTGGLIRSDAEDVAPPFERPAGALWIEATVPV